MYAAVVDYELTSFQLVLNLMNRIQCDRVRIFHDGVFYGYSKYFALQISRVDSNIHVNMNKKFLLVRIKESDSKSHVYLIHIAYNPAAIPFILHIVCYLTVQDRA